MSGHAEPRSSLSGRSLLTLADFSAGEIRRILDRADELKQQSREHRRHARLSGRTIALIFEKRSTRTRAAFETAFGEEGGHPVFLSPQDVHLGVKESVEDTARVLGRMFDCIQFRGYQQRTVETLAEYSGVPVYNGLTDRYHPTQALADIMTLREQRGSLEGATLAYTGDGRNNVANSLLLVCAILGIHCRIASPESLQPDREILDLVARRAVSPEYEPLITTDPVEAVTGADAVYTDVWTSMGEEAKQGERVELLRPYQVHDALMAHTQDGAIFLHCLPAVKGNEVTEEVFEGARSRVFEQAENRKHTIKAVILETLAAAGSSYYT
ncbi:MAG: ornithine carbamoyltransferase [Spirochaetia bacterium]